MASRIACHPIITPSKRSAPVKRRDYLAFIHDLPCVVTGLSPVEAAHLSKAEPLYGHLGRAKGRKASDRWVIPLCSSEHRRQHDMNELAYWREVGVNPYLIALVLFGLWSDMGDDALPYAERALASLRRTI